MTKLSEHHVCDFCGKSKEDVEKLIVGEHAAICNDCINLSSINPFMFVTSSTTLFPSLSTVISIILDGITLELP